MRKTVHDNKHMPEGWEDEFNRLYEKQEMKYTLNDIKHENSNGKYSYFKSSIAKRREKRMIKLEEKLEKERQKMAEEAQKQRRSQNI